MPVSNPVRDDRNLLLEAGARETARSRRYGRPLGVVVVRVLPREIGLAGEVLRASLRDGADLSLRRADGYAVLAPETATSGLMHLAARLQEALLSFRVRAKVGFAVLEAHDGAFRDVLARADAMVRE